MNTLIQVEDRYEVERYIEVEFNHNFLSHDEGYEVDIISIIDKETCITLDIEKDFDRIGRDAIFYNCHESAANQMPSAEESAASYL